MPAKRELTGQSAFPHLLHRADKSQGFGRKCCLRFSNWIRY